MLSLNVSAGEPDQAVDQIKVVVTQSGQQPFTHEFKPPTTVAEVPIPGAGGAAGALPTEEVAVLATPFYERIKLPSSWKKGVATVDVTAFFQGTQTTQDQVEVTIRPERAFAVFVDLSGAEEAPVEGVGGQGGAPAQGGAGGMAGAVPGAGMPGGGAAGTPTAGAAGSNVAGLPGGGAGG